MDNSFAAMANTMKRQATPPPSRQQTEGKAARQAQAERLQERAIAAGFSGHGAQAALARAAKVNPQTLGSYWTAQRGMHYERAKKLAAALGNTTAEYLLLGENHAANLNLDTKMSQGRADAATTLKIKLFALTDFSYFVRLHENIPFEWKKMFELSDWELLLGKDYGKSGKEPIAVAMKGDSSMEPRIPRDATVLVLPDEPCTHGKTVLALFKGMHLAEVRLLLIERGKDGEARKILRATNNADGSRPDRELDEAAGDWCWRANRAVIEL
jgi:transcriptional regulator with XRE-family HTH domain